MIAIILAVLLVDGALILGILWRSVNVLYQEKRNITSALNARGFSTAVKVLMIAPPAILLLVAVIFLFSSRDQFFAGFAHTLFLLGMWMGALLAIFTLLLLRRLQHLLQLAAMLAFLCAIIPILYFTSTFSFQAIFEQLGQIGYVFPFIEGIAMIAISYPILMRLNKTFH